ncbi:MAG: hypothetical protein MJZ14_10090 [Paludibacteraceae bacterium]|nr:hypothetical protein [Paludibacteraceae bacterium]
MIQHLVTFGKDKNSSELRNIKDVSSGLACNCVCPCCGSDLEAHKGNIKRHHFQHHSSAECKGAFESQIHLLSKSIIEKNKSLMLPQYIGQYSFIPEKKQVFSEVIQEVSQDDLRPDCLCKYLDEYGNEQELWVEILFSHAVDENKVKKIRERHIACIEIDVSQLFYDKETIEEDVLTDFLLSSIENRMWINNPLEDERILKKANEVRMLGSMVDFLINNYEENSMGDFYWVMYCLFLTGYRLSSKDYSVFYNFVKSHKIDYQKFDKEKQWRYISAVQILLCHLTVIGRINDGRYSREQQLFLICLKLNKSTPNLSELVNVVIQQSFLVQQLRFNIKGPVRRRRF